MEPMICRSFIPIVLVVIAQTSLCAGGSEVEVLLKNGVRHQGELLAVRDSSILLSMLKNADEEKLSRNLSVIMVIRIDSIIRVMEEGHSHVLAGVGIGLFTGVIAGAALASKEQPTSNLTSYAYAGIGGLAGLVLGGVVGFAVSGGDQEFRVDVDAGREALKSSSRYPYGEPSFLRSLK